MAKIDPADPRLTAYALDEMSPAERTEFEQLLHDDPAARAAVEELRRTAALLADALAAEPLPARGVELPVARPRWLRRLVTESWTLWVPLGAVACFGLFFWRVYLPEYHRREAAAARLAALAGQPSGIPLASLPADPGPTPTDATEPAAPRPPRPAEPTGLTAASTAIKTGHFLTARQNPSSQVAIDVGSAAYADVRRNLEAGLRPPTGLVRIEELVNHFPYRYPRPSGPDTVALSTEMHTAPWAQEHLLVRIGLQGREALAAPNPADERPQHAARDLLATGAAAEIRNLAARDVKVQVDFNPDKVLAYRLIGYEGRLIKSADAEIAPAAHDLAAGRSVTALYEVIPLPPAPARGTATAAAKPPVPVADPADTAEWLTVKLRYTAPGAPQSRSVIVPLHAPVAADTPPPSADFQFAAAVAGFGLILQDNPNKGRASWDMVEELAQAGLADDHTGQRKEFISLVQKARELDPAPTPAEPKTPAATPQ